MIGPLLRFRSERAAWGYLEIARMRILKKSESRSDRHSLIWLYAISLSTVHHCLELGCGTVNGCSERALVRFI
jgi:hypothetical protein